MATFGIAENLTVLVIDDQAPRILAEQGAAASMQLDFSYIGSWAQAQRLCATSGDMGGADILLIDVSFETDRDLEKLIDGPTRIIPVGPVLALPYIGKRSVMSCICYSAHIANPRLQANPWFLIAMGLILARTEGIPMESTALHSQYLSEGSSLKQLDKEIKRLAQRGYTSQTAAPSAGLEDYRDNLRSAFGNKSVTLVNRHSILQALVSIGEPTSFTALAGALGPEAVHLVGSNWKRSLSLRSLFADVLRSSDTWEVADAMKEIRQWFIDIPSPTPLELALDLMSAEDRVEPLKERIDGR